jgi:hypothetical protein
MKVIEQYKEHLNLLGILQETNTELFLVDINGLAVAQAVSRQPPTTAARVRFQVKSCGIYGRQNDTGAGFLRVRQFPLPVLIPPITYHPGLVQ